MDLWRPYVHTYLHTDLVNTHKMETFTLLRKAFPWRNKGRLSSVLEQKTHLVNLTKLAEWRACVFVCLEWILGFEHTDHVLSLIHRTSRLFLYDTCV